MSKKKKLDTKTLDLILEKMIDTVDISKNEIFRIGEQCRKDPPALSFFTLIVVFGGTSVTFPVSLLLICGTKRKS